MIIKNFEFDKLKSINLNIHLIYGNNEGIKQDIIYNLYLKDFEGDLLTRRSVCIRSKRGTLNRLCPCPVV